jgi:outer membrane protein TolC
MVLENEVLRWQLELAQAKLQLQEFINQTEIASQNWRNLIGATAEEKPETIDWQVATSWQELLKEKQVDFIEKFMLQVQQANPLLQLLKISQKMADKQHGFSKSQFLPSLNLQYNYQLEYDDKFDLQGNDSWSLAAIISIPLWSSGANYSNFRSSKATFLENSQLLLQQKKDLLLAAENSALQHYSLAQKIQTSQQNLNLAERNYALISDLYEQGMISGAELKDAETMLRAGEMELIGTGYDFIISQYEIKKWSNR